MKLIRLFTTAIIVVVTAYSCSTVPLTGRKQLNILPESQMISMSLTSYSEFLKTNKISDDRTDAAMVTEVGKDIAAAVTRYLTDNNLADRVAGYQWEFNLIDDKTPNAWCMPGGKVVVYTGILPFTQDKNGLAVVLSHEIAHAVARHGNERMSQTMIAQFGNIALDQLIKDKPEETKNIFNAAYGAGAQVGIMLPFSREHELEADKLGLIFMAMAGYDPANALTFWERMGKAGGAKPPEFLSTHPSDQTRLNKIKAAIPEAERYYKK